MWHLLDAVGTGLPSHSWRRAPLGRHRSGPPVEDDEDVSDANMNTVAACYGERAESDAVRQFLRHRTIGFPIVILSPTDITAPRDTSDTYCPRLTSTS